MPETERGGQSRHPGPLVQPLMQPTWAWARSGVQVKNFSPPVGSGGLRKLAQLQMAPQIRLVGSDLASDSETPGTRVSCTTNQLGDLSEVTSLLLASVPSSIKQMTNRLHLMHCLCLNGYIFQERS